jgi:phosphonate transport system substrate-binding protein
MNGKMVLLFIGALFSGMCAGCSKHAARQKILCLTTLVALMFCIIPPVTASQKQPFTIAVIPSSPPVTLHKIWAPFVERLSHDTGVQFSLKMYEKMADFERDIWSGVPDFIFASPIQTVVAHKSNGYLPLVRGGKPVTIGLYVRKDSPIKTIDDLAGKKVSFVGNKNLCSVYVRHLLSINKNQLAYTNEYAGSTKNVIFNVLLGKSDAGGVFVPELAAESEDTRNQLRVIIATPEIAPHPLSAHARVPRKVRDLVKNTILAIASGKDSTELFQKLRMGAPVSADYDRDYRAMEAINIEELTNWGK